MRNYSGHDRLENTSAGHFDRVPHHSSFVFKPTLESVFIFPLMVTYDECGHQTPLLCQFNAQHLQDSLFHYRWIL